MSLMDIVPVLQKTTMTPPRKPVPAGRAEVMRRWQRKNREHLRRYKRAWKAKRKSV